MAATDVLLAGVGRASNPRTYSGTPYFLLAAAQGIEGAAWSDLGLDVRGRLWQARRYVWNLASLLTGRGTGGYQFTDAFLERLWGPARRRLIGSQVLNWTQLYPSSITADDSVRRSFYIDQTLGQLFSGYGVGAEISPNVCESAMIRERLGYTRAHAVITTSEWGRHGVLAACPEAAEKAHVVLPGANLPLGPYERWAAEHQPRCDSRPQPLRLLFVGLHPERKGLDRLLRSMLLARAAGSNIELTVIGVAADQVAQALRNAPGVRWIGRVSKLFEIERFLAIAADHDIGILLSRAEASAISLREYQAMGLAVLGPDVGGCPELVLEGAGVLIAPSASDQEIAEILVGLEDDRWRVASMRERAWALRDQMLWPHAAERILRILLDTDGDSPMVKTG